MSFCKEVNFGLEIIRTHVNLHQVNLTACICSRVTSLLPHAPNLPHASAPKVTCHAFKDNAGALELVNTHELHPGRDTVPDGATFEKLPFQLRGTLSLVSPRHGSMGRSTLDALLHAQCLLKTSAGFSGPGTCQNSNTQILQH